jgi:Flp pilus assembly protein TadD
MANQQDVALTPETRSRVNQLLQTGKAAYDSGDKRAAHDACREAALLDPYDERVWMGLARVVDGAEDKRVCLENALAINPYNSSARQQLRAYTRTIERSEEEAARYNERLKAKRRAHRRTFMKGIGYGIAATVVAIMIAFIIGTIIYGLGGI